MKLAHEVRSIDSISLNELVDYIKENSPNILIDVGEKLQIRVDLLDRNTFNKINE